MQVYDLFFAAARQAIGEQGAAKLAGHAPMIPIGQQIF
jgi:hypothetical protein